MITTMSKQATTVQILNELEMAGFIKANGTQCRFVSMVSRTPVVKIKAGNPFHKVSKGKVVGDCQLFKVSRKVGIINANYNTAVRNRIAEKLGVTLGEVEYTNGTVWYEHLMTLENKPLPLVQHKDEMEREGLLLQYFPHKTVNTYVNAAGAVIPDEQVKPWLYAEAERSEYKPAVIAVYLKNIVKLTASGVIMVAEDYDEAEKALAAAE